MSGGNRRRQPHVRVGPDFVREFDGKSLLLHRNDVPVYRRLDLAHDLGRLHRPRLQVVSGDQLRRLLLCGADLSSILSVRSVLVFQQRHLQAEQRYELFAGREYTHVFFRPTMVLDDDELRCERWFLCGRSHLSL